MEKCKSKKLLWRVNKSYARELLPKEPLPVQLLPWHLMQVVNMGARDHTGTLSYLPFKIAFTLSGVRCLRNYWMLILTKVPRPLLTARSRG